MKSIGATPIGRKDRQGADVYTIPVLSDPNTGAIITDTLEIASYLEKTYPEKPIFPNNSEPFIRELNSTFASLLLPAIKPLFARTAEILSPVSGKFFTEARSVYVPLPWGVEHDEDWDPLEKMYNTVYEWYQKTEGKWIMGDAFSYADITVASSLLWYKRVVKEDEWARISSWNGGKWVQLLADVEQECNLA
ncbi:hypothetical protein CY34DRAFT_812898 [Suillus luteus UH-Slu-Lm8-n1]|uniref:Glutathione transferase n=1 Tax=Suillus luteus UH-Slu-Lm8-n1 TaxID=930992 RepID=A0A0D0A8K6_9AGAM|nr:hypothetical protein CY34DRAFT_812898 [Suillus luteus UH-Slu-Lm8-n1]